MRRNHSVILSVLLLLVACQPEETPDHTLAYPAIRATFAGSIDPTELPNYADLPLPSYLERDNLGARSISDAGATLGRVLFYDRKLSVNNTISCASCHRQEFAFGDTARQSLGMNGVTGRHSMRLAHARFGGEERFFWDERAASLEEQTTQPIQDHLEMGYSGKNGDPGINDLIDKLAAEAYYRELFTLAFGDSSISEERMQLALAQFVRSLYHFDSRYDEARAAGHLDGNFFPNYDSLENAGKRLFIFPLGQGGAGCAGCHVPPEFGIAANIGNNGVTGVASDPNAHDYNNTRAPSLRELFQPSGALNGPFMHDGSLSDLEAVLAHYSNVPQDPQNTKLDQRLRRPPGGNDNGRILSTEEKAALIAFLKTLSGEKLYHDERFSDPFPK